MTRKHAAPVMVVRLLAGTSTLHSSRPVVWLKAMRESHWSDSMMTSPSISVGVL